MGLVLTDAAGVELSSPPPPLQKTEAEAIAWFHAFCAKHKLAVIYRCAKCFRLKRPDGMNQDYSNKLITPRMVRLTCRCGIREYVAPLGTGDLPTKLSNSAIVLNDS